jgi:hypothetical protein
MATIEEYRTRETQSGADALAATSDHSRFVARRSEGAWRRLAELREKREGRTVPVPAASVTAPKKTKATRKPKLAKAA